MNHSSQWSLLGTKRFLPLFLTQFLGAFNDNIFKNALVILLAFNTALLPTGISSALAVNISAALFILPFLLFSAIAGQLADFHEKSKLIFYLKIWELGMMVLAAFSLYNKNVYLMWLCLFGLGMQAAFFGPLKYSILPQHLQEQELIGGNALIESGTFVAILAGTILGGVLISMNNGSSIIMSLIVILAVVGIFTAKKIPSAPNVQSGKMSFNIFKQSISVIQIARQNRSVFLSILGISWFWFFGATLLSQFPLMVKDVIGADASIATLLLTVFSVGIAAGSLLCDKLSQGKVEIGLVPFGAIGLSLFGLDLFFALEAFKPLATGDMIRQVSVMQFINAAGSYRILSDLLFLSAFGGFFTVPLYALIQSRSSPEIRSRIIGANNIMNALFMISSAIFAIAMFKFGFSINQLILGTVILNTLVCIYIFTLVPEFLMRFIVWILTHTIYKIKKTGLENIPESGSAIVICNHVSFMDALIIFGSVHRPVKFVMYYKIFNIPFFKYMFNAGGAIPIASKKEDQKIFENAFIKMEKYLNDGEIVVIFPEGAITKDGELQEFKPGILKILEKNPVPVIPSYLSGLWGAMFSKKENSVWRYIPKSFFGREVVYSIGLPIEAKDVELKLLENKVLELRK